MTTRTLSVPVRTDACELAKRRMAARMLVRARWLEHLRTERAHLGPGSRRAAVALADSPRAEVAFREAEHAELSAEVAALDEASRRDRTSDLAAVARRLDLDHAERGLLELCVAVAVEPGLAAVCAELNGRDDAGWVTLPMAGRVLELDPAAAWPSASALFRWRLLWTEPGPLGGPSAIAVDPHVLAVLRGDDSIDPALGERAEVVPPLAAFSDWPVADTVDSVRRIWSGGRKARVHLVGPEGIGRRAFAAIVARELEHGLLAVETPADADSMERLTFHAERESVLLGLAPLFHGSAQAPCHASPGAPLSFQSRSPTDPGAPVTRRGEPVHVTVTLPAIRTEERGRLLELAFPNLTKDEVMELAKRHRMRVGELADVRARGMRDPREIERSLAALARERMREFGTILPTPFGREDLILRPELDAAFDRVLAEARVREEVLAAQRARDRLVRGAGLHMMFHGPPGTGKTMMAQVLARILHLPLVRIDIATVLSKYIGEQAKALRRIYHEIAELDAILFFDEADALFARRTELRDSHDRHANADTGQILTLLEDHDGISVLCTNARAAIDPAVERRLRHCLEFKLPDREERARLWENACRMFVAPAAERQAEEDGVLPEVPLAELRGLLAEEAELSGAEVRSAALTALVTAADRGRPVNGLDVVRAVEIELAKSGRSMRNYERVRSHAHG